MVNLTRAFRWLSIRNKLLIAFAGLSIVPVALVGVYDIISNVRSTEQLAFSRLTQDVSSIRGKAANFLTNIESDLRVLQNSSSFRRYTTAGTSFLSEHWRRQSCEEILSFARSKEIYYQIRFIDAEGNERLRIEDSTPGDTSRTYRSLAPHELSDAGEIYYDLLTDSLSPGQIAFAPAELIAAGHKQIPVISFAMPLYQNSARIGILIANVFAQDLFHELESDRRSVHGSIVLVSGDGYYLFHSKKKSSWNKLLASREEDNLRRDYPPNVAQKLLVGESGVMDAGEEIISYAPLFPRITNSHDHRMLSRFAIPLFVFEGVPKKLILGPIYSLAWIFAGLLGFFLAGAIGLGLLATRQFTKPIAEMYHGAEIIASGNYDYRLTIETRDEIEQLAGQFNQMASSLKAREVEISQHHATLEKTVRQRTAELTEEKAKLQAIIDNVPSAFVLVNDNFRIQSASARFAKITGRRLADVRGQDCHAVLCGGGLCHTCICEQVLGSGCAESHIDEVIREDGQEQFFEHIAIPMTEDGNAPTILEIITDITQRKRLEQNLIRTERLMAAGEMSAIIAHEFRNALTSIKMILQLQNESERLGREDKRSLGVALNSLFHMENVVTELLHFGRPSPLDFKMQDIASIIDESLTLVQMQLRRERIHVLKAIEHSLPRLSIDPSHMKEALINILLNAVQAIKSKQPQDPEAKISVTARTTVLRNTLRDAGFLPATDGHPPPSARDGEIVLSKGTACVLVEISDTGIGIDTSAVSRIFDPFFTTKTNGTGLGLPMVKRTVNAHGGVITVRSRKGKGSTFGMYIPMQNGHTDDLH